MTMPQTSTMLIMTTLMASLALISSKTKLLMSLISLEMMTLSIILLSIMWTSSLMNSMPGGGHFMIVVVFSVCEAALGLALLVKSIRKHGNDNLKSMSMIKY